MSTVKVTYFNITGRGEPVRYILAYSNVDFIDNRIAKEEWEKYKSSTPFGQLPILEIDGKTIHQSMTICRFLAQKYNLVGKSDWDKTQCDMMADTVLDMGNRLSSYHHERFEVAKKGKKDAVFAQVYGYLDKLDVIVQNNGGFLVDCGEITWPDLILAALSGYMNVMTGENLFASRKNLQALIDKVKGSASIKKYLETRPPMPL